MYIIPIPHKVILQEGIFKLCPDTLLLLEVSCNAEDLKAVQLLKEEILIELGLDLKINKGFKPFEKLSAIRLSKVEGEKEAYKLSINEKGVHIIGGSSTGLFYGLQTLRQIIRQQRTSLNYMMIEDKPYFKHRGFYHDVTRGKVPTLETLKLLVDRLAYYKINQLQLYIEHTFAFKGMSEVWVDKDPLTAEEILILDAYCKERHIELIPSLSTFGHLYEVLRTHSFTELCELEHVREEPYLFTGRNHTLNATDVRSIELVKNMLEQYIPLFSSDTFNICCDETFELGKGKSKAYADEVGVGKLYTQFLNQIVDFVKGHGKKVMFWSDVILHHPELLSEIPEDVIGLTWDYLSSADGKGVRTIAEAGRSQYVCPGVGGWSMMMNLIGNAFENIRRMVAYGVENGAIGVLNTDWGDFGHVNFLGNSIPGMAYGAGLSWNPNGEKDFETMYEAISLLEFGDHSKQVVGLLHKLSASQNVGWCELVRWKEKGEHPDWLDIDKILRGYQVATQVDEALVDLSGELKRYPIDMKGFIVAAKGIQLIDLFYLYLIKGEEMLKVAEEGYTPWRLAEAFEEWIYEFQNVWRMQNKESELAKVREVVMYVCHILRTSK